MLQILKKILNHFYLCIVAKDPQERQRIQLGKPVIILLAQGLELFLGQNTIIVSRYLQKYKRFTIYYLHNVGPESYTWKTSFSTTYVAGSEMS